MRSRSLRGVMLRIGVAPDGNVGLFLKHCLEKTNGGGRGVPSMVFYSSSRLWPWGGAQWRPSVGRVKNYCRSGRTRTHTDLIWHQALASAPSSCSRRCRVRLVKVTCMFTTPRARQAHSSRACARRHRRSTRLHAAYTAVCTLP